MELNSKKLEFTARWINYSISIILCIFLVLLSNKIINDLNQTRAEPNLENFENFNKSHELKTKIDAWQRDKEPINAQIETIDKTRAIAKENYSNEKQSFDNWVQTRTTLASPSKDMEVLSRTKKLDEYYAIEQEWRNQQDSLENKIKFIESNIAALQLEANRNYNEAVKSYDLNIFLIRLLFVAPILALGIFFFIRFRTNKFWPLYFGFTLFSLYVFFFGLVPYLPSYGGYIRYSVGIVMSIGLGYYAIKSIRKFIDAKQAELKTSTQERAKNVQKEVAEKAFENHYCPSCGKDFLSKKWEITQKNDAVTYSNSNDYCTHCGLELFHSCTKCTKKTFAHLPFCGSCGDEMNK